MVLYVAVTFWLMVGLLEAYAIFKLFEGLVRPRWINLVLLPGTIVAELAHFLAALLTGAPVREAKLVSDELIGETTANQPAGIPVLSPLLMALLPILAGLTIIYSLYRHFDASIVTGFANCFTAEQPNSQPLSQQLAQKLYWSLGSWFQILRDMLSLSERLVGVLPLRDLAETWKAWLFIYLTTCVAVRMVPLRGNLRSGMAAVLLIGGLAALLSMPLPRITDSLLDSWPLLAYVIATLTLLLLIALIVRGGYGLAIALAGRPASKRSASRGGGVS